MAQTEMHGANGDAWPVLRIIWKEPRGVAGFFPYVILRSAATKNLYVRKILRFAQDDMIDPSLRSG